MDELVESILDYVKADYTDYAVMINGEWGSGKTYFWNTKVKNKIENIQRNGKNYTTIYMSLYGISNLEEISKKIFIETTQVMDKNLKKYMNNNNQTTIPEYAKTGLDMANLFGVIQNGEKMDYSKFFSTQDKVLCFDDLERANVDVIDILGYINNFVEHDHIKTIIICNEKELSTRLKSSNLEMKTFIATYLLDKEGDLKKADKPTVEKIQNKIEAIFDKANEYERIKEKLIGETFEYVPEFNYIINGLLSRYEGSQDLIRFLKENTKLIINTFERSQTKNLRILKHALGDFQKIFETVNNYYPNTNNRVLQTMLIFTIAISFEIKAGKVEKDRFKNIQNNEEYKAMLVTSRVLMDNKQSYIKEFDSNYYYNFKAEYRFFKFIETYIRTRIFEMRIFKENMEVIINTVDTVKLPAYKRLLTEEYWKISDEKFDDVINEIIQGIEIGSIELIDIVKLYAYFKFFIKKGILKKNIKQVKQLFIEGMNKSASYSSYCENINEELGQILLDDASLQIEDILEHFNNLNNQLKKKMYKEKAEDLFRSIPMRMENFYEKLDKEYMAVPIFAYYDSHQLFQRLSCASNEDIVNIKEKLKNRVSINTENLEPEVVKFIELKQKIDEFVKNKDVSIKNIILMDFANELEEIIKKYPQYNMEIGNKKKTNSKKKAK